QYLVSHFLRLPHTPGLLLAVHSVPTRRSSDLAWGFLPLITSFTALGLFLLSNKARYGFSFSVKTRSTGAPAVLGSINSCNCPLLDRKSTRLHSSHVIISYAVFCWKKENKKQLI